MYLGVVAKQDTPRAAELADRIRARIDATVSVDEQTAERLGIDGEPVNKLSECDLVVSIGGDGTFLFTAREVSPTPVMGVNLGEVGFLNAVSPDECVEAVRTTTEQLRSGDAELRELPQVRVEGKGWTLPPAVNEIAILGPQRGRNNGLGIEISVDGQLYSEGHADGVLISTPAGSSAYNLSEGGPLVHPDVSAFVVTEMCTDGTMPSLAVPTDAELTVELTDTDHAFAVADGRTRERVDPPTEITLGLAADPVRVAGPPLEFFAALDKLD